MMGFSQLFMFWGAVYKLRECLTPDHVATTPSDGQIAPATGTGRQVCLNNCRHPGFLILLIALCLAVGGLRDQSPLLPRGTEAGGSASSWAGLIQTDSVLWSLNLTLTLTSHPGGNLQESYPCFSHCK